jgi:hypothetical protein
MRTPRTPQIPAGLRMESQLRILPELKIRSQLPGQEPAKGILARGADYR